MKKYTLKNSAIISAKNITYPPCIIKDFSAIILNYPPNFNVLNFLKRY